MSFFKRVGNVLNAYKTFATTGSVDKSIGMVNSGNESGYQYQSALNSEQDKLLRKALSQMGLTAAQTSYATNNLTGSPRKVIETALGRAAELQDGGGGNGSAFDTR